MNSRFHIWNPKRVNVRYRTVTEQDFAQSELRKFR